MANGLVRLMRHSVKNTPEEGDPNDLSEAGRAMAREYGTALQSELAAEGYTKAVLLASPIPEKTPRALYTAEEIAAGYEEGAEVEGTDSRLAYRATKEQFKEVLASKKGTQVEQIFEASYETQATICADATGVAATIDEYVAKYQSGEIDEDTAIILVSHNPNVTMVGYGATGLEAAMAQSSELGSVTIRIRDGKTTVQADYAGAEEVEYSGTLADKCRKNYALKKGEAMKYETGTPGNEEEADTQAETDGDEAGEAAESA